MKKNAITAEDVGCIYNLVIQFSDGKKSKMEVYQQAAQVFNKDREDESNESNCNDGKILG